MLDLFTYGYKRLFTGKKRQKCRSPPAKKGILGYNDLCGKVLATNLDHLVSDLLTKPRVDPRQSVKVKNRHKDLRFFGYRTSDGCFSGGPVGKTGNRVRCRRTHFVPKVIDPLLGLAVIPRDRLGQGPSHNQDLRWRRAVVQTFDRFLNTMAESIGLCFAAGDGV